MLHGGVPSLAVTHNCLLACRDDSELVSVLEAWQQGASEQAKVAAAAQQLGLHAPTDASRYALLQFGLGQACCLPMT